ncbi:MAG: DUF58 domain-containing protein, partial [Lachnospiraceae bacterium]|nr:DUF58 domain-containing protein [Lachnospiraceae bacterium]
YRTGLFVFLLILVTALPPASYFIGRAGYRALRPGVDASTHFAQTDDTATAFIMVDNPSFFPIPDCHITCEITSAFYPCEKSFEINIPAYSKAVFSADLPLEFKRCGCYQIRLKELSAYDYLHVFSFKRKLDDICEINVYPRAEETQVFEPSAYGEGFDEFEETAAKGNTSSNVTDIREYIPGDRLQKIHWKLSAKTAKLMVKENEQTSSNQFTILTELYLPEASSSLLNESLTHGYNLAMSLIKSGQPFFLSFYSAVAGDFTKTLILSTADLDRAFSECFYLPPYQEEDLALSIYTRAGFLGGTILHVTHKGVEDVVS